MGNPEPLKNIPRLKNSLLSWTAVPETNLIQTTVSLPSSYSPLISGRFALATPHQAQGADTD